MDETFFQILKTYGSSPIHRFGTATTEEFQQICEQVSGQDLNDFFQQWIYGEYYPIYNYNYVVEDSSGLFATSVRIRQDQTIPTIFHMPIDLYFETISGDTTIVVDNYLSDQTYQFVFDQKPTRVQLDPDDWILKIAYPTPTSVPEAFVLSDHYPNPFKERTQFDLQIFRQGPVSITIYNMLGQRIKTLFQDMLFHQRYTFFWDGKNSDQMSVPSGVYFCSIQHPEMIKHIKIVKLR
jgi:hypothetical protein